METALLIIGILALFSGLAGFLAGCWAVVNVLAFQRSTHTITQMPVQQEQGETIIESDLPRHILDQLPSPPEKLTAAQYAQWEARQALEDDFFNE